MLVNTGSEVYVSVPVGTIVTGALEVLMGVICDATESVDVAASVTGADVLIGVGEATV